MSPQLFDIIIVGGGVVGLTFAHAMAQSGLKIAILDKDKRGGWDNNDYDLSVVAITYASKKLFQSLNVWDQIVAKRVSSFERMVVWDGQGNGEITFNCHEVKQESLGFIVENKVIKQTLESSLEQFPNVYYQAEVNLLQWSIEQDTNKLVTAEEVFKAPLVIGADGANSWVRRQANIDLLVSEYNQTAIVTMVKTQYPHQKTAWQHFLPEGPLAFLPLNKDHDHYCSIVWSNSIFKAQSLMQLDDFAFKQALAEAFEYRLGEVSDIGKRVSFPLYMRHAKNYVKPGLALIGDAAHTIHPLAGQGVNLGLLDAAALAEILKEALDKGRSLSSLSTLRVYERWRKTHNLTMIAAMEGFKRLFSNDEPWLRFIRSQGLNMTNRLPFVKHSIIKRAMGLAGDLPKMVS